MEKGQGAKATALTPVEKEGKVAAHVMETEDEEGERESKDVALNSQMRT